MVTINLQHTALSKLLNNKLNWKTSCQRSIEPGSILVTGIPNTSNVILHCERGNLETISIKLILIDRIELALKNNDWKEAFNIIRIQKMNTNVLVDINPTRFLNQVVSFIRAIKSPIDLNQVIEELVEENVFNYIYVNCLDGGPQILQNKVKTVCEAIIKCIVNSGSYGDYASSLVTCCYRAYGVNGIKTAFQHLSLAFVMRNARKLSKFVFF